ncbi:MAG: DUF202 domain-containing protein [Gammaproteobacteria bacterium]|nr:DUF202 domain-containing protein [Gammaproteobacteria bacterium]
MDQIPVDSFKLAILRTRLSNTRTLLAYIKTSIGLFLAAFGLIKFVEDYPILDYAGWMLGFSSIAVAIYGYWNYFKVKQFINDEESQITPSES